MQGIILSSAVSNIDNLPEASVHDGDWDLYGALRGESVQAVGVKRRLQDLQEEHLTMKRMVLTTVAEAIELAKGFLRSSSAPTVIVS